MAEITLPANTFKQYSLDWIGGERPLNFMGGSFQAIKHAATLVVFQGALNLEAATAADKRNWRATFIQLLELENYFKISEPDGAYNGAGYSGTTPQTNSADQAGNSITCDNAQVSTTVCLKGDPIEVNGEYKYLTSDATSNGSGIVTFNFKPALRDSLADNTPVEVITPKCWLRLVEPRLGWSVSKPDLWDSQIVAVERYLNA